jgi:hypothetical protein
MKYLSDLVLQQTSQELRGGQEDTSDRLQFSKRVRPYYFSLLHYDVKYAV